MRIRPDLLAGWLLWIKEKGSQIKLYQYKEINEKEISILNLEITILNYQTLKTITMNLDDLLAKVQAQKTVEDSAVALLAKISQELKDALANGADPAKIQAISDALDANTKEIADAVAQNTTA